VSKASQAKNAMPQKRHKTGFRGPSPDVGKETQFKPGNMANPGGRPKKTLLSDASREWLEQIDKKTGKTNAQLAAEMVGKKLLQGSAEHYRSIGDRTEGKPPQAITIGGSLDLDVENIDERIKSLLERARARAADSGRKK
jgi:hypothetical protein